MTPLRPRTGRLPGLALAAAAALGLAACGPQAPQSAPQSAADQAAQSQARPHGWVEGATEIAEPKASLASIGADGAISLTDLADFSSHPIGQAGDHRAVATDSRFLAILTPEGLRLVDTGVWTVDHGDHQHYYEAPARDLGLVDLSDHGVDADAIGAALDDPAAPPLSIDSSESLTAVRIGAAAVLLDREALGAGRVEVLASAPVDPGSWVGAAGGGWAMIHDSELTVLDQSGAPIADAPHASCDSPGQGLSTRAGMVFTCADGALVVTATISSTADDATAAWAAVPAPLPEGAAPGSAPVRLDARASRPVVAGLAPTGGAWVLRVRDASWLSIDTDIDLVAITSLDDSDDRVVGVDSSGAVHVWAESDGSYVHEASTDPLVSPQAAARGLHVTQNRLYALSADSASILEINPADGASVARSFDAAGAADTQEVGL
ncbi:hypothetical protein M3T53_07550 [Actinomyces sp. B33]|uniref:hypothetical protein n=1 Tax=Actinomyces sp. B33 TaxID=2942131 RepID=UPI00233F945C|nr:hypothetical protein [Actinomyces sp. B33]MDC4233560.1 hypothetical protein [Actinomyces sp. B33]